MKILSLHIQNFLTIGDSGLLKLDGQGLVLIQGTNLDDTSATSNGVGKSSIPDALSWVNFGETARDVSGDDVVNTIAKKDCMVQEVVQSGENVYVITRYRKHSTYKNQSRVQLRTDDGKADVDISKGTEKETQALIEQILGCSKDVFMAAIYAGQETAPDLPGMTDKQLKLLIEEAAGVQKIESALQLARKQESEVAKALAVWESAHSREKDRIAELAGRHARFTALAKDFETGRADRKTARLEAAKSHLAAITPFKIELKSMGDESYIEGMIADLDKKLKEHAGYARVAEELRLSVSQHQRLVDRAASTLAAAVDVVKKTNAAIANAAEEMKKPCGECGKPHTEAELDEFVAHLNTRKAREMALIPDLKDKWEIAKGALVAETRRLEAAEAAVPSVILVTEEKAAFVAKKVHIQRLKTQIEQGMNAARAEMKRAEEVSTEKNSHQEEADRIAEQTIELGVKLRESEEKLVKLRRSALVLEHAVKVFGPAGVRAHILDTVTPYLNAQTADYLSALSDGNISATWSTLAPTAKGELREKFNIDVSNSKGAKTFKGLSGGEKRKVRLSTMLALQDLVATRASNPVQLWIGDEIDDALDTAGLERLMGVLERKAREKGTVLIISHNDLKSWIDNVVTVTKEGGKSTIAGALS